MKMCGGLFLGVCDLAYIRRCGGHYSVHSRLFSIRGVWVYLFMDLPCRKHCIWEREYAIDPLACNTITGFCLGILTSCTLAREKEVVMV